MAPVVLGGHKIAPREDSTMGLKGSQRIAVLLCKFADAVRVEPQPRSYYEDLVAKRGTGGLNDYWRAASLGSIDLDGSQVFGWEPWARSAPTS